jgi:small subunit ribosomal protein S20
MPNHVSSEKRARQDKKRQEYNRFYKVMAKRAIKDVLSSKTADDAQAKLSVATKILDRVSVKGIIPKNYASNRKSKLALFVNSLRVGA